MDLVKKIFAGVTAGATVLGLALPVLAQDLQGLLNQILSWLSQNQQVVQQVVQQVAPQVAGVPAECQGVTFTRNLRYGMSGNDVKCLQALLGVEPKSGWFGPKTKAAVIKFQEDNAAEILAPLGLTKGTGVVGPSTRAALNKKLQVGAPTVSVEQVQQQAPSLVETITKWLEELISKKVEEKLPKPEEKVELAGEEGELEASFAPLPTGVKVYEGDQNVAVAALRIKAKDADVLVQRIDVKFNFNNDVVYKYLTYASLYDGENAIKGVALSKDTMTKVGNDYTVRFSGLNVKVAKDTTKEITLKVSAASVLTATGTVNVSIPENGIRYTDPTGAQKYADVTGEKQFDLATAETGSVEISLASASPAEQPNLIDTDADTEITLVVADLKAKNQDVTIDTVKVRITSSVTSTDILNAIRLYDGSTLLGEESPQATTTATTTFSNLEIKIAKDTTKSLTVKGLVKKNTDSKTTAAALTSVSGTDAKDNAVSSDGSADGKTQHLYTAHPVLTLVNTGQRTVSNTTIQPYIQFKVKAVGGDIYVKASATTTESASTTEGVYITGDATGWANAALTSDDAELVSGYYKVPKGEERTFEAKVNVDNAGGKTVKIANFNWDTDTNNYPKVKWGDAGVLKDLLKNFKVTTTYAQ